MKDKPTMSTEGPIHRLYRDLGLKPLYQWWAKVEILLGLVAVAGGLFGGMRLAALEARIGADADPAVWLGMAALVVLGGYLTLAGHRSHLYQWNNRLAAYLAELIRAPQAPPRDHP
jgi:hypothetical protein